jgi:GMP synthase-like glutamine amidotransferase
VLQSEGHHPVRRSGVRPPKPVRPRAPQQVFELGVPVLGICYGMQTMAEQLGGKVAPHLREFGYAEVK